MTDLRPAAAAGPAADDAEIVSDRLPAVASGSGCHVYDTAGRRYIDGSGGPAVFCLGYAHPDVNAAIESQLRKIAHGYRYTFTSEPLQLLTELVCELAGPGAEHLVFVNSGSEAMDSALKIALQYHWSRGEPDRVKFIARRRSYHGNTIGALSVSGFSVRRQQFEGALLDVSFVSSANEWRPPDGVPEGQLVNVLAAELETEILRLGPQRVAAFVFEPVVGAAGGVIPAPAGYARCVREICDRYGVLMIADEVMCGAGRCGTWRALQHDGTSADIMTLAKGLSGGFVPLGAVAFSAAVAEPITARSGGPNTGHTLSGHTLACAAALAVQRVIVRDHLLERVREGGETLAAMLNDTLGDIEAVGQIRGRGFFFGIEFVADRETRRPMNPALRFHDRLRRYAFESGLICYPVGGTLDGHAGDVAILAPPYIATDAELEEIVGKFDAAVRRTVVEVSRRSASR